MMRTRISPVPNISYSLSLTVIISLARLIAVYLALAKLFDELDPLPSYTGYVGSLGVEFGCY